MVTAQQRPSMTACVELANKKKERGRGLAEGLVVWRRVKKAGVHRGRLGNVGKTMRSVCVSL